MTRQYLTRFIGRERELADLQRLLATSRLVTITGAGGSGKTRLATQAAQLLADAFAHGVHFIPLAALNDPTLLIPTIAQVLGVSETPDQLILDSLKAFLHRRQLLLVLDNFEQIVAAAPLLLELLMAAEQLNLLVTSREVLRIRGEQEFPLAPLGLIQPDLLADQPSVTVLAQVPSIRLFVERARASQPDFALTDENMAVIAELCTRLDGLPLAIELAAVRIKLLPPQAMLARLQESSLGLLTGGSRDLPARQQTLRAAIQWSYDLLTPNEQLVFRWLSVFIGGCTLEAIVKVLVEQLPPAQTLDIVDSLLNKSLLRQVARQGEPRLTLLETIRDFGWEQLNQISELGAAQQAHAFYYLSLAEESEPHLAGSSQRMWLQRLEQEQANFRAALRWSLAQREGQTAVGQTFILRLTATLSQFWYLRGHWNEGRRWLEEAIQVSANTISNQAVRAKTLLGAATLIQHQGDLAHARALCEQSHRLYRDLGDQEGVLASTLRLCRMMDYQGDQVALPALLAEGLTLAESLPDGSVKAQAYRELSFTAVSHGTITLENAEQYLWQSEQIYRSVDNLVGLANTSHMLGIVAELQGEQAGSRVWFAEAERLLDEVDDQHLKLGMLGRRMTINMRQGAYALARQDFEKILAIPLGSGQRVMGLGRLAVILQRQGLSQWAARVFGLADKLAETSQSQVVGRKHFERGRQEVAAVRVEVAAQLGEVAFAKALAAGRSLTLEDLDTIPHPASADGSASPIFESLTRREAEVINLLAEGLSNPEIAARLVISRRTVGAHLQAIYGKLGVKSRESAVRVATEHNLIDK